MPNFSQRSTQTELLDRDDIPFNAIQLNMAELDRINTLLGGHAITIAGLVQLLQQVKSNKPIQICEIGCGGGDNLRVIRDWCKQQQMEVVLTGVDINPHCIRYAAQRPNHSDIHFICSDYRLVQFTQQPHIIFSSLFCHHFNQAELVDMLQWCSSQASIGYFINDLHRHPLAFYSIKGLTQLFSKSYLVKNDAPISVLRGFNRAEWELLLNQAGIAGYSIQWKWAFRWLIIVEHTTQPHV
jgi:hypothetical protein